MQHLIAQYGYIGLFVISLLSAACLPIPSEVAYGLAGAYCTTAFAAHPQFTVVNVVVVATLGTLAGSIVAYELGRYAGRALVDRYGKYLLLSHKDLDASEVWFNKYGAVSVFVGRLIPVVRSFISLPAGLAEMKRGPFIVLTTLGSALWALLLTELGYRAGKNQNFVKYFKTAEYPIVAIVVLVIAAGVWHRWHSMKSPPRHARGRH
jgi:membrane protein DedA with SNARE-associated domain